MPFQDCSIEDQVVQSEPKQDFVLLKIVSRDKEKITDVKNEIAERIQTDSIPLYLDFPPHGENVLKDKEVMVNINDTFFALSLSKANATTEISLCACTRRFLKVERTKGIILHSIKNFGSDCPSSWSLHTYYYLYGR